MKNTKFGHLLILIAGIGIGVIGLDAYVELSKPDMKTDFIPAFSVKSLDERQAQAFCLHLEPVSSLNNEDIYTGKKVLFSATNVSVSAIGDRGLVCDVSGEMITVWSKGTRIEKKVQPYSIILLADFYSRASEKIDKTLAHSLKTSSTIHALTTNQAGTGIQIEVPNKPLVIAEK